jgi:tetratricopeptide (TPR) repeat protein
MIGTNRIRLVAALSAAIFAAPGCLGDEIKANQQLVQQQQGQIEEQQREIARLQTDLSAAPASAVSLPPTGGCDKAVEQTASQRGGERFSSGDFPKALGYYQDALIACPTDDRAEINVARSYEAMGDKQKAITHYRIAANRNTTTVSAAQDEAKAALLRLQAPRI